MKKLLIVLASGAILALAPACNEAGNAEDQAAATQSVAAGSETSALPEADPSSPKLPKYQADAESLEGTTVEFADETFDFGEVPEGTKVTHRFKFNNTGEHPLVLTRVKASCGCTSPSYSEAPVPPGGEGFIDVEFDSSGKPGFQNKSVTVTGNFTDGVNKILRIKGQVKPAGA